MQKIITRRKNSLSGQKEEEFGHLKVPHDCLDKTTHAQTHTTN